MELFGINIVEAVFNPGGTIAAVAAGAILFQGWRIINSIIKPVKYIDKLYGLADSAIEKLDNSVIDKIRSKSIKDDIQKELRNVLLSRKEKIDYLIRKISD